jgi:branched-subunit amino acid ABC-type transport system permease component
LEAYLQILVSGLTLGAMYAVGTIGLSLAWGALKMLNMAHSSLIAIGGYASYAVVVQAGLPGMAALPAALIAGALVGALLYYAVVRFMYRNEAFETNVFIATFGIALVLENLVLKLFGAYPLKQPFAIAEGFKIGTVHVPWQNLLIFGVSVLTMLLMAWGLARTRTGRAIRATAQNREAAQLMGVATGRIFAQVLAIAGALAAMSGVLLSSIATLSPQLGFDPMLKAFIICVIAGLGNIAGALYAAFALGLFEAVVQYFLGVRWALPLMMMLVIVALIWRPYGVFGQRQVTRL